MPVVRMQGVDYISDNNGNELKVSNLMHLSQVQVAEDTNNDTIYTLNTAATTSYTQIPVDPNLPDGATMCWDDGTKTWVQCSLQVEEIQP